MKKTYRYNKCSLCRENKNENRSPYCNNCAKKYGKEYRLRKSLQPNVNIEGLGNFIKSVERRAHYIMFQDILTILFFYEIITTNIKEYDDYKTGRQIQLMWRKIYKYYHKRIQEK